MGKEKRSGTIRAAFGAVLTVWLLLFLCVPVQASADGLSEICRQFEDAMARGEGQASVTVSVNYTLEQLEQQIAKAAEKQQMLYTGGCTYQKRVKGEEAEYIFYFADFLIKVKRLKNEAQAYQAALKALRDSSYTVKFYSAKPYDSVFMQVLRQHPEYNYDTLVWKDSRGIYGYKRSSELTKAEQNKKMQAADRAAAALAARLKKSMTAEQKLKKIHDILISRCSYDYSIKRTDGCEDSFTAYGALVRKKAVCQGYAAAFNLTALKAGIPSIAVYGRAAGESHTWNYVRISGKNRYIDCTWDKTRQTGRKICYDYFMVQKSDLRRSHVWKEKEYTQKHLQYCRDLLC